MKKGTILWNTSCTQQRKNTLDTLLGTMLAAQCQTNTWIVRGLEHRQSKGRQRALQFFSPVKKGGPNHGLWIPNKTRAQGVWEILALYIEKKSLYPRGDQTLEQETR